MNPSEPGARDRAVVITLPIISEKKESLMLTLAE